MPASATTDNPLSSGGRGARHLRLTPAQSERYIAAVESRAQEAQREAEDAADAAEVISRAAVTIQRYARGYIERTKEFKEHKLDVEEFTASELVGLLASCVLPLMDVGSDFGVMVDWARAGPAYQTLLIAAIAIHLFAGTITGLVFTVRTPRLPPLCPALAAGRT
jgi:hypothetical protein